MYSVVRFFPVLLLVKNQAAGNSRPSIVYFLKAKAVRREITIKANFVGARPIKIVPQSANGFPADNALFQTGAVPVDRATALKKRQENDRIELWK